MNRIGKRAAFCRLTRLAGLGFWVWVIAICLSVPEVRAADDSAVSEDSSVLGTYIQPQVVDQIFKRHISDDPATGLATGAQLGIVDSSGNRYIRGYGISGAPGNNRDAMDPERHLYRIASQTKVFTAIGILQLYERGLLDLDVDVNEYLTVFKIENPLGGETLTARHFLNHSSGLDDDWAGVAVRRQADHRPLAETFVKRGIRFIRPTGALVSYTNRSYMFLGHLIEAVSGQVYEDYIQEHILDLLEMDNSTFVLSETDRQNLAWGTSIVDGEFQEVWVPDTLTRPSGDLMTNAEDMTHFLAALLGDGSYKSARILKPETLKLMLEDCRLMGPGLPGRCLGPSTRIRNGVRSWGHGGGHPGYSSLFVVDRELGFGTFLGFLGSTNASKVYFAELLDAFYPASTEPPVAVPIARAREIEGVYRRTWSSMKTFEKLGFLFGGETELHIEENKLLLDGMHFVQVEPLLLRSVEMEMYAQILLDEDGNVRYIQRGTGGLEKMNWYESGKVQRPILYACLGILALYLLWGIKQLLKPTASAPFGGSRWALSPMLLCAVGWLSGLGMCFAGMAVGMDMDIMYEVPAKITLGLVILKLATVLTVVAVSALVWTRFRQQSRGLAGVVDAIGVLAAVVLVPWSVYWQVL